VGAALNTDALRTRTAALHAKLDAFQRRLAATPPSSASWPEVLSMFGVLSAQLAAAAGEVRPEARHYALHPTATAALGEATPWWRENALPGMHSVRLEPAQEAEAAELLAAARVRGAETLGAVQRRVDARNAALKSGLEALQARRAEAARVERGGGGVRKPALQAAKPADAAKLLSAAQWGTGLARVPARR